MEQAPPESAREDAPEGGPLAEGAYPLFLANSAAWFSSFGISQAMVAWLVVGELGAGDEVTGIVQASAMAPSLLLIFIGGQTADHKDPRRMLLVLHLLAALPPLALAFGVYSGLLSVSYLILCSLLLGACTPFGMPAREILLWRIGKANIERAVTGMVMVQFGFQAAGMRLADFASSVGSVPILLVQALLMLVGLPAGARLPKSPPRKPDAGRASSSEIFAGLGIVWNSELRWVWVLTLGVGLFFGGSYWTVTPLMLRELTGSADGVGGLLSMFQVGTMIGSVALLLRGGVRRKGLAMAGAIMVGACALLVLGRGLSYPGMLAANLVWGLGGAVFLNMGRTLFQLRAPAAERARVLAMNFFGFLATAPLGAMLSGFISGQIGPLHTLSLLGLAMLLLVGTVVLVSPLTRME